MAARKKQTKKPRKGAWFVRVRGSYLPVSWQGWLLYVPFTYLIISGLFPFYMILVAADLSDESLRGSLLMGLLLVFILSVPYFVALVVLMTWIARRKS